MSRIPCWIPRLRKFYLIRLLVICRASENLVRIVPSEETQIRPLVSLLLSLARGPVAIGISTLV